MADEVPAPLAAALGRARQFGFLGPGPIDRHVQHGHGFARVLTGWMSAGPGGEAGGSCGATGRGRALTAAPAPSLCRLVDLGSGGGVPGLVLAYDLPQVEVVLLEANGRRADLLADAVRTCDLGARVEVLRQRAEETGRDLAHRGRFDAVVARSFGPPPVTAECAAPLLRPGGLLVTSEPPGAELGGGADTGDVGAAGSASVGEVGRDRWPAAGLARLGMAPLGPVRDEFVYQVVVQREPCPERFPRRTGVPGKRPLF